MKKLLFYSLLLLSFSASAQSISQEQRIKKQVDSINRLLDHSVVRKAGAILQKHYADDFVFTHGTGLVDSKQSWIKNVLDTGVHYVSRAHDSVNVELHGDIAIVNGQLTVHRKRESSVTGYALKYVRVYVLRRNIWQMISHRTTSEWHLD